MGHLPTFKPVTRPTVQALMGDNPSRAKKEKLKELGFSEEDVKNSNALYESLPDTPVGNWEEENRDPFRELSEGVLNIIKGMNCMLQDLRELKERMRKVEHKLEEDE